MAGWTIEEKLAVVGELFPDGGFDTYFARSLGERVGLGDARRMWEGLAEDVRAGTAPDFFMLYAHTPFCFSRCSYCIYDSSVIANQAELAAHLVRMNREISALGPAVESLAFNALLVGGGTPGLHVDKNFDLMLKMIVESFRLRERCVRSVEMTPVTMTDKKARIMARYGVNRVSLGVQTATDDVLRIVNRGYQTMEHIENAIANIRRHGIEEISVDLIAGLPGETKRSFAESVARVAELSPDTIVLYRFVKPEQMDAETVEVLWEDALEMFFERTGRSGFDTRDSRYDFAAVFQDGGASKWLEVNDLQSEVGSTLLGLGAHSFSNLFAKGNYYNHGPEDRSDAKASEIYQRLAVDLNAEAGTCVRRFIEFNRALPRGEYKKYFGKDPVERFHEEFRYLTESGLAVVEEDAIRWLFRDRAEASRMSGLFLADATLKAYSQRERRNDGC